MSSRRMQDESGHARADLVRCLCPTWLVHEESPVKHQRLKNGNTKEQIADIGITIAIAIAIDNTNR
jgi:hypothetical protein